MEECYDECDCIDTEDGFRCNGCKIGNGMNLELENNRCEGCVDENCEECYLNY